MAIVDNRVTEEGDVLIIKPEIPIVGLIALTQFVDTTFNETETDYFLKEFRYSLDGGLNFSSWIRLSLENLQDVNVSKISRFVIEYRYTRVGSAPEVDLEFQDILVSGTIESLDYPVYKSTVFNRFFNVNDINVFTWALNVLEKLYIKGNILPFYIRRGEGNNNLEDEDFISFWNSITHYFAILVYYARQYEDISSREQLLLRFFESKLIDVTGLDEPALLQLYAVYIEEFRKRGTERIANNSGELPRLLNIEDDEEFAFFKFVSHDLGWCIGKSSPTWYGTEGIVNINKGFEFTEDVQSLTNYPIEGTVTLNTGKIDIGNSATFQGVGGDVIDDAIVVSDEYDYEIRFKVSQDVSFANIRFGLIGYNASGVQVNFSNENSETTDWFLVDWACKVVDTEYLVIGILWNKNKSVDSSRRLNVGEGYNLVSPANLRFIIPQIGVQSATSSAAITSIRSISVKPRVLNFSRGQLGRHNAVYLFAKNANNKYSDRVMKQKIQDNMIPYNSFLCTNWLTLPPLPQTVRIYVTLSGSEGAFVSGDRSYNVGDVCTLVASIPIPLEHSWDGWYEGEILITTDVEYVFTVSVSRVLSAKTSYIEYSVSVSSEDILKGTVVGSDVFHYGDEAEIVATPESGYTFVGWYDGEVLVSSLATYSFSVIEDVTLVAHFADTLEIDSSNIEITDQLSYSDGIWSGTLTMSSKDAGQVTIVMSEVIVVDNLDSEVSLDPSSPATYVAYDETVILNVNENLGPDEYSHLIEFQTMSGDLINIYILQPYE